MPKCRGFQPGTTALVCPFHLLQPRKDHQHDRDGASVDTANVGSLRISLPAAFLQRRETRPEGAGPCQAGVPGASETLLPSRKAGTPKAGQSILQGTKMLHGKDLFPRLEWQNDICVSKHLGTLSSPPLPFCSCTYLSPTHTRSRSLALLPLPLPMALWI